MEKQDREIARIMAGKGISWNDLPESKKELARKVYSLVSTKLLKLEELSEQIDALRFNKQSLAEEIGINRKTLGSNNPEVSKLIDVLVKKGQSFWSSSPTAKHDYKSEIEALNQRLSLLYARDAELIDKDNQYREMEKQLGYRNKQYEKEKKKREELEEKLKTMDEIKRNDSIFPSKGKQMGN